jgi:hypothetical protein
MALRGRGGAGLRRARGSRAGLVGLVLALYLGAGALSTWPALQDARHEFLAEGLRGVPGAAAPGDHLQTTWQLWLPGHQVGRGEAPWVDPYSFRPESGPRANFAAWPFGIVFWPLHVLLGTVGAWNAFLLLGYLGAGGLTFLWLRSLGLGLAASAVGGLAFALAPYRAVQAGAGHLLAWISMLLPFSLWTWERRRYWLFAAALASIPLSGQVHLALGVIPFVVAYALVRGGDRRWLASGVAASLGAGLVVWALAIRGSIGEGRSFAQVDRYSAHLVDFVSRSPQHGLETFVFLGWLVPVLALLGAVLVRSRLSYLLAVGAVVPMLLALGGNLPGYETLWETLPGLGSTRVPTRFMAIGALCIAALAALTVDWALDRQRRVWPGAAAALLLVLVALDLRIGVTAVRATPADEGNRAYAALADAGPGRLLELPVYPPDRQEGSVYLYYAMQAPRERPAGYSSVAPRAALTTTRALAPCPSAAALDRLGVRFVAVVGRLRCPRPGAQVVRDGPVAVYRR